MGLSSTPTLAQWRVNVWIGPLTLRCVATSAHLVTAPLHKEALHAAGGSTL
jgi:hypothetical protein